MTMYFVPISNIFHDDPSATNLGQWQTFENENPDVFSSMYEFWIQKAS